MSVRTCVRTHVCVCVCTCEILGDSVCVQVGVCEFSTVDLGMRRRVFVI